jgi:regulator of nucleoside diphosphate kinase
MAKHVYVSNAHLKRLRDLAEGYAAGRDAPAAERLEEELDRATIVEQLPPDVVGIGSRVRFEDRSTGAVREVALAWPQAADASAGRVSVLAPVGAALLGLRTGDSIEWPLPDGRKARIRILSVAQAPAEAGETAA